MNFYILRLHNSADDVVRLAWLRRIERRKRGRSTAVIIAAIVFALVSGAAPASAQPTFTQAIIFGDSTVDSGYYKALPSPKANPTYDALWAQAVAAGAGAPTSSPGLMNSQVLAAYFGLPALPANQPGGTDYATSGAKGVRVNNAQTGGFGAAVPTVDQIANYLSANGGRANPNGLYLISTGGNDVSYALGQSGNGPYPSNPNQYLLNVANNVASAVAQLQAAGARYIIVPDLPYSFPTGNSPVGNSERAAKLLYSQAAWSSLSANGVSFIPADVNAVRVAIVANPAAFGFQFVGSGPGQTACSQPAGITTAWALLCSSNPNSPSTFVAPNADQIYLFADDQHLTTAGQKIMADYYYSLVVAPSEISMLAESAVQARFGTILGIQQQVDIALRQRSAGFNVWLTGEVSKLSISNQAPGFPSDPDTPLTGTLGFDYRSPTGWLLGGAVTLGAQSSAYSLGGGFHESETAGSLYAGYRGGAVWGDVIVTYGALKFDVNRIAPIGITLQANVGSTGGANTSVAAEAGYDFVWGRLTHGPVVGAIFQHVMVGGFTETGSFTSLSFGDQTRDSEVSALGYRASFDAGAFTPFAQLVWNHEFASLDRQVVAALTTITAPSYTMPAVAPGRDWGTATLGTTVRLGNGFTGLAAATGQFGQSGVSSYGLRLGLNYSFGQPGAVATKM
jgi:outer membrane lipase/esterase